VAGPTGPTGATGATGNAAYQAGPGLTINAGTTPQTIDVVTPYLPLSGGTINNGASSAYPLILQTSGGAARLRVENLAVVSTGNISAIDLAAMTTIQARTAVLLQANFTNTADATRASQYVIGLCLNGGLTTVATFTPTTLTLAGSLTAVGLVNLTGSACAYQFQDVSGGYNWQLYATAGVARLWHSGTGAGDKLTLDGSGNLSVVGSIAAAGGTISGALTVTSTLACQANIFGGGLYGNAVYCQSGSGGDVNLISGDASHTGYIEWRMPNATIAGGARLAFMGWDTATSTLGLHLDQAAMFSVNGNIQIGTFIYFGNVTTAAKIGGDNNLMTFTTGTGNNGFYWYNNAGTQVASLGTSSTNAGTFVCQGLGINSKNVGGYTWAQLNSLFNLSGASGCAFAWNFSAGGGETNLFINRDGGGGGGLQILDFPNTSGAITSLMTLTGAGVMSVLGSVTATGFFASTGGFSAAANSGFAITGTDIYLYNAGSGVLSFRVGLSGGPDQYFSMNPNGNFSCNGVITCNTVVTGGGLTVGNGDFVLSEPSNGYIVRPASTDKIVSFVVQGGGQLASINMITNSLQLIGGPQGSGIIIPNMAYYMAKDTGGNNKNIATFFNDNNLYFSETSQNTHYRGNVIAFNIGTSLAFDAGFTVSGSITMTAGAGVYMNDRTGTSPTQWCLYPTVGAMRFYNNVGGDRYLWNNTQYYPNQDQNQYCGIPGNAWFACQSYNYNTASDIRLKEDVSELPDCLGFVRQLAPKRFRFRNAPPEDNHRSHWGFIAQEVGAVLDAHDFGGHRADPAGESIAYNELTAVLWKACQELADSNRELAARIEALEARVA
jgi:hypothetical protein